MKTCLIVDDSSVIRKVASRIIEEIGYEVEEAEDGREAFEKCRKQMPDAIMVDWHMPVMSGLDFVKQLRGYIGGEKPKVLFCTTENDVGQIAMALKAGADKYMMKPFDKEVLTAKIAELGLD